MGQDLPSSDKEKYKTASPAAQPILDSLRGSVGLVPHVGSRRAASQTAIPENPPQEVIAKAIRGAADYSSSQCCSETISPREAERLLNRFWPRFRRGLIDQARRYYDGDLRRVYWGDHWILGFKFVLEQELLAKDRFRRRRREWQSARIERRKSMKHCK
jgi:hypothetical protein